MPLRLSPAFLLSLLSTILLNGPSWGAPASAENQGASLLSLPYVQYVETEKDPNKVGTTIYNKEKAFSGYNIYTSHLDPSVFVNLVDMDGTLVHRWAGNPPYILSKWYDVTPFPDGSLFLTSKQTPIDWQRVDAASHTFMFYDMPGQMAHHASYCLKEGGFLSLVENKISLPFQGLTLKVRDNSLVHMSAEGRALKTIPLSKLFADDQGYQKKLEEACAYQKDVLTKPSPDKTKKPLFDFFHANNIENLEQDIPGIAKKGDWLVTVRNLDRIIIVDPNTEKIIWQWGENIISKPHHATFLERDRILLLDNGVQKESSRAIVIEIPSGKILWQYGQKSGQEFFTAQRGSAQRLANGNTLIAESDKGRVFEVTESGEIVWEWYADFYTQGLHKGKRRVVYRMARIPYDFFKGVTFNHGKI